MPMVTEADVAAVFLEHAQWRLTKDYLPKIVRCIEMLSEEEIWARPNECSNSIGNILLHLCGNVRQWIVHGIGRERDLRNRSEEFAERGPIPKDVLLDRLETVLHEADSVLENVRYERILDGRTIQGFDETVLTAVFHVVEHFAQHLGQVIYITKAVKNIDLNFFPMDDRGRRTVK